MYQFLEINRTNNVYFVTLKRPEVRNAFNPDLIREITQAFSQLPPGLRLIVLRGAGKIFCSGADLEWMKSMVNFTFEENQADSKVLYEMFKAINDAPVPVIAVVQGAAMGGGLGLMACGDVVIAEENSQFCFSEVRLGLAPAVISSFILDKVASGKVAPWMISGKIFGVKEAEEMGLVHHSCKAEDLESALKSWGQSFLDAAPEAVAETKKLIRHLKKQTPEDQMKLTTALIAQLRVGHEGQEGLKSFLEKRQPAWKELIGT